MINFVLIGDEQRKEIVEYIKPQYRDIMTYDNLNLAYGVEDTDKHFVLTRVYCLTDAIMRCGAPDQNSYIVLAKGRTFNVTTYGYPGDKRYAIDGIVDLIIHKEDIEKAIALFNNRDEKKAFEKSVSDRIGGLSLYSLVCREREKLFPEKLQQQKEQTTNNAKDIKKEKNYKHTKPKRSNLFIFVYSLLTLILIVFIVFIIVAFFNGLPITRQNIMGLIACILFLAVCICAIANAINK